MGNIRKSYHRRLEGRYPGREIDRMLDMALEEVMGITKTQIRLGQGDEIPERFLIRLTQILERLETGEPIQYVLGFSEFYGLRLSVNPSVLIPRPETEELVRWILEGATDGQMRILDLATGSGCIAVALAKQLPIAKVYGLDFSVEALNLAESNARQAGCDVEFFHYDILERESLNFMTFDVMVSNPPYVVEDECDAMAENVIDFEPHEALFVSEQEPLIFYRRIVDLADGHLASGGKLFFEINERYGPEIRSLLVDRGYTSVELKKDLSGKDRMIKANKA